MNFTDEEQSEVKLKAALFDMDGTLLDTLEDLADSMNAVLARWGFETHEVEAYKYFVGEGMENLVKRALPPESRDESTIRLCVTGMNEEYAQRWAVKTRLYDGIHELLDGLARRRVVMAILSNKPQEFVRLAAEKFLGQWSFEVVLGARDSHPRKPDPAAAKEIAGKLGLASEQILYAGDSNTDMLTARGAEMYAVGVCWGFRTEQELLQSGALEVVHHPLELIKFF